MTTIRDLEKKYEAQQAEIDLIKSTLEVVGFKITPWLSVPKFCKIHSEWSADKVRSHLNEAYGIAETYGRREAKQYTDLHYGVHYKKNGSDWLVSLRKFPEYMDMPDFERKSLRGFGGAA